MRESEMATGGDTKLPLTFRDVHAERLAQFRELFPEAFTEGKTDLKKMIYIDPPYNTGGEFIYPDNPQQFLGHAVGAIQKSLHDLMVQGIEYERIADAEWEMHRLESEELESYVSRLLEVRNSIYDVVEFESKVEYEFAKALDARKDIKLFFKLPDWFKVETPLGTYNPDWAIVREEPGGQNKVYLVRETKGTKEWFKIPEIQRKKIQCGKAHFKAVGLKDGGYDWVASAGEV
jgi:type III restriction enzyme